MAISWKKIFIFVAALVFAVILSLVLFLYFGHQELKKSLISRISAKATGMIGHNVKIGDLSISHTGEVNLYDIKIENPPDFSPGHLLKIKKLNLKISMGELARKKFYFHSITVFSPELNLSRDDKGRMNISEKLRLFFKRESKLTYQIDTFDIKNGFFDFNKNELYRNMNIDFSLRNLSSEPSARTSIKGSTIYGNSSIKINGWAYLKDEKKRLDLMIIPDDFQSSPLGILMSRDKISGRIKKLHINLKSEKNMLSSSIATDAIISGIGKCNMIEPFELHFSIDANTDFKKGIESTFGKFLFSARDIKLKQASPAAISGEGEFDRNNFSLNIPKVEISGGHVKLLLKGKPSKDLFPVGVNMNAEKIDLKMLSKMASGFLDIPYEFSGKIGNLTARVTLGSSYSMRGSAVIRTDNLSVMKKDDKKVLIKDTHLNSSIEFKGKDLSIRTSVNIGKISLFIHGTVNGFAKKDRVVHTNLLTSDDVKFSDIRNSFWDIFPDGLLYAGLQGSMRSDISVDYQKGDFSLWGEVSLKNFVLEGEYGEYSLGSVNGTIPVNFTRRDGEAIELPSFERSDFEKLNEYYSTKDPGKDYSRLTAGAFRYGFKLIDDINIWFFQSGNILNIGQFSGNIFGGKMNGSAVIDLSKGVRYRAGFLVKGISLAELCEEIEPIKGYISGKVDGIGTLKGSGTVLSQIIGKAEFWTYSTENEETKISREFLHKVGGPSLRAYLRDRKFDKGIMSIYLQNGYIIFDEFEISNRNFFGIQDLMIKVAPFNNRISIDHLMWSIAEAAERAKEKQ